MSGLVLQAEVNSSDDYHVASQDPLVCLQEAALAAKGIVIQGRPQLLADKVLQGPGAERHPHFWPAQLFEYGGMLLPQICTQSEQSQVKYCDHGQENQPADAVNDGQHFGHGDSVSQSPSCTKRGL